MTGTPEDAETFEDELDAHIAESMKDPEYAAHHHWLEWSEAEPWVRRAMHTKRDELAFKAGFAAAARLSVTVDEITELLAGHDVLRPCDTGRGWCCRGCGQKMTEWPENCDVRRHESAMEVVLRRHQASVIVAHINGETT